MCLQNTLGEDPGTGHFYLAENRTFLLCIDTLSNNFNPWDCEGNAETSGGRRFGAGGCLGSILGLRRSAQAGELSLSFEPD